MTRIVPLDRLLRRHRALQRVPYLRALSVAGELGTLAGVRSDEAGATLERLELVGQVLHPRGVVGGASDERRDFCDDF